MKIGFLTFGSTAIGMGHVFRCLRLAGIASRIEPEAAISFHLAAHAEAIEVVHAAMPEATIDASDSLDHWEGTYDLLVVDRLAVPASTMAHLAATSRCLVSIDDPGEGRWLADIAVNPLYGPRQPRPPESRTVSLEGVQHSLLDPSLATHRRDRPTIPSAVLLVQGSGDPHGLLPSLACTVSNVLPQGTILHVLTGPSFRNEEGLDRALALCQTPCQRHRNLTDPAPLFAAMTLAITSIGVTACEIACLGIPLLMVTGEEKELETAALLEEIGAGIAFGRYDPGRLPELADICRSMLDNPARLRAMGEQGARAIDGRAGERLMQHAVDLAKTRL